MKLRSNKTYYVPTITKDDRECKEVDIRKQYKVEINFDEASKCWRENKKYMGGGLFVYKIRR